jgi:hypothetical protein
MFTDEKELPPRLLGKGAVVEAASGDGFGRFL